MPKSAGTSAAAPPASRRRAAAKSNKSVKKSANPLASEIKHLSAAALGILLLLSVFTENGAGFVGGFIKFLCVGLLGCGAFLLPFVVLAVALFALFSRLKQLRSSSLLLSALLGWCLISLIHISAVKTLPEYPGVFAYFQAAFTDGSAKNGGLLGALLGNLLRSMLGTVGAFLLLLLGIVVTLLMLTGRSFSHVAAFTVNGFRSITSGLFDRWAELHDYDEEDDYDDDDDDDVEEPLQLPPKKSVKPLPPAKTSPASAARRTPNKSKPGLWVIEDKPNGESNKVMLVHEELAAKKPPHPILRPRKATPKSAEKPYANPVEKDNSFDDAPSLENDLADYDEDTANESITVKGLVAEDRRPITASTEVKNACLPHHQQKKNVAERPAPRFSPKPSAALPPREEDLVTYTDDLSTDFPYDEAEALSPAEEDADADTLDIQSEDAADWQNPVAAEAQSHDTAKINDDEISILSRVAPDTKNDADTDDYAADFETPSYAPPPREAARASAVTREPAARTLSASSRPRSAAAFPSVKSAARQEDVRMPGVMPRYENYEFPPITLLTQNQSVNTSGSRTQILENSRILEETLKSFRVEAKVIEVSVGPTVTRYDLAPGPGVKVSSIANLSNDLALSLAAQGIRIEAPIPGKAAVGIEIPNKDPQPVLLREIIEDDAFGKFPSRLAFAVGKDIAGSPIVTDVARMPHLLIAGATGSGKSVCINTLITSLLYKSRPDEVKLLMIDPKVVELSVYNGIPHLLIPVVTDPKKASGALQWAVTEMDNRYGLFAEASVRDLKGYNQYLMDTEADEEVMPLPQIVIIIDELADLMMICKGDVEESICRLAQKARAAGIHLIVATQRPSVDVITGLIKANIPSRLAFAVSSGIDSRTVLDTYGAEKLLGKGDMLFLPMGKNKPIRLQGGFISDKEVENVVDFLKAQTVTVYPDEMIEKVTTAGRAGLDEDMDEFFQEAVEFLLEKGKASTSMLQRQFRIGYNRASRLMDDLEARGIVGPEDGVKPRKIMITREEYYN